ncbi:TetR family transcriptional regulator [Rheinheimera nanhaiensis]|uniref:TetR/AcrR family transcriptional regulator, acrAB operon repressor n=1 Tax=Rheinheimera nanhaiensis E407-8 TaxID=562729 RepID=I1DW38_9GAMM|nr:TetR family transcriptional regulator [Rheinheimera nanhaiensis]GAB58266.1 TetR/AcrR family transcriptional regulator, acrAB operon repressor [Rheinheimera nanhaiensis E407-8]
MARRTKAEAESTRAAILDAAEVLFYQQGVSRTTLEKIAVAANVTRGAIYWHFQNKADLFNAMLERVRLPFQHLLDALDNNTTDEPFEQIRQLYINGLQLIASSAQHHRVLTIVFHRCEYIDELNPAVNQQDQLDEQAVAVLQRAFERAQQAGSLREGVSPRLAAMSMHMYVGGIISHFLLKPQQCDLRQHAPVLIDTMLQGLKQP